jgi:uncharacterized coiled-coil protein SlyX
MRVALALLVEAALVLSGLPHFATTQASGPTPPRPKCVSVAFNAATNTVDLTIQPSTSTPPASGYSAKAVKGTTAVTPSVKRLTTGSAGVVISFPAADFASKPTGAYTFIAAAANANGFGPFCSPGVSWMLVRPGAPSITTSTVACDHVLLACALPAAAIVGQTGFELSITKGSTTIKREPYKTEVTSSGKRNLYFYGATLPTGALSLKLAIKSVFGVGTQSAAVALTRMTCEQTIAQRDQTITQQQAKIAQLNGTITQQQAKIAQRDQTITQLQTKFAQLNQTVAQQQTQAAQCNQTVAAQQTQIAQLNGTIAQQQTQAAQCNQTVAAQQTEIVQLNQTVVQQQTEAAQCNQTIAQQQTEIGLCNSYCGGPPPPADGTAASQAFGQLQFKVTYKGVAEQTDLITSVKTSLGTYHASTSTRTVHEFTGGSSSGCPVGVQRSATVTYVCDPKACNMSINSFVFSSSTCLYQLRVAASWAC